MVERYRLAASAAVCGCVTPALTYRLELELIESSLPVRGVADRRIGRSLHVGVASATDCGARVSDETS